VRRAAALFLGRAFVGGVWVGGALFFASACAEPRVESARARAPASAIASAGVEGASAAVANASAPAAVGPPELPRETLEAASARVGALLGEKQPTTWGQAIEGVLTRFEASEDRPAVALTFDACGGPGGDGYDAELIELLRAEKIRATLFLTARWIEANGDHAKALAADPLFLIENHGDHHRPCSVNGRSAFHIPGTRSVTDAVDEVYRGASAVEALTGKVPQLFRPGTAYFDDVCVEVVQDLGTRAMGFSVIGDAAGGFGREEIAKHVSSAPSGSVILLHMNLPRYATAEGLKDALPALRSRGVALVRLDEVTLQ
jgi:peptidoglycan/xylan/chitin deacetylase (PgdA/CDA1 family)